MGASTPPSDLTRPAARTDDKVRWIDEASAGRATPPVRQVRLHLAAVTEDVQGMADLFAAGLGLTPEQAVESPFQAVGTVDAIVETLQARRERWGFSDIGLSAGAIDELAPVVARLAGR